jgi:hypothetical protein
MNENGYLMSLRNDVMLMRLILSIIREIDPPIIEQALNSDYLTDDQRLQADACRKQWGF